MLGIEARGGGMTSWQTDVRKGLKKEAQNKEMVKREKIPSG